MYCGNNARSLEIRKQGKKIGTRYTCFRRGVGIGLGLPYDPSYATRYVPIDKRKVYCGKSDKLPQGYDMMGNNPMCMRKGVGVGRSLKAKKHRKNTPPKRSRKGSRAKFKFNNVLSSLLQKYPQIKSDILKVYSVYRGDRKTFLYKSNDRKSINNILTIVLELGLVYIQKNTTYLISTPEHMAKYLQKSNF